MKHRTFTAMRIACFLPHLIIGLSIATIYMLRVENNAPIYYQGPPLTTDIASH